MTRTQGLVSIIVPVFDRPRAFSRCLRSLAEQSYKNREIIVINDGSRDTAGIRSIVAQYPDVIYQEQTNQGACSARNHGFSLSHGEFALFCDADIILRSNAIQIFVETLTRNQEASYCYSSFHCGWKRFAALPFDAARLRFMNFIHTTSLMRVDIFPGFDTTLKRFQDWDVWLTLLERGHVGIAIPQTLFRITEQGTMSVWLPKFFYKWFPNTERVRAYTAARDIVLKKHRLNLDTELLN